MSQPFNEVLIFKGSLAHDYWEQVQRLERENAALRNELEAAESHVDYLHKKANSLRTENDKLREAIDSIKRGWIFLPHTTQLDEAILDAVDTIAALNIARDAIADAARKEAK